MGMPTEQTVAIIEAVKDKPNYWWALLLAIVPVIVAWVLNRRDKDEEEKWERPTHNID